MAAPFTLLDHGRVYRILFRLSDPAERRMPGELFAAGGVDVVRLPAGNRAEVERARGVVRAAPYVVSPFGEAFLLVAEDFPLDAGDRLEFSREGIRLAEGVVAEVLAPESDASSDRPSA